jgi:hypothetical protein
MTHQHGGHSPQGYTAPLQHYPPPKKKRTGLKITLVVVGALVLMGGCLAIVSSGGDGTTTATTESSPDGAGGTEKAKPKTPGIGDTVKDGKFSFKVTKLENRTQVGSDFLNKKAQGKFLLVHVTVKNIGDEAQSFFGNNQKLLDSKGRKYEADAEAAIYLADSKSLYEEINPGNSVKGRVLFDVPKQVKVATIMLHDSAFSDGVKVDLTQS